MERYFYLNLENGKIFGYFIFRFSGFQVDCVISFNLNLFGNGKDILFSGFFRFPGQLCNLNL